MSKSPTVSDIARAANVSPSTVSRVLTGNTPVAPDKRAAVLAAIEQLNFRPNLAARALVSGRTMAIGVLTQSMASQFYGELAQGIEDGLDGSGYHPVFASGHWRLDEERDAMTLMLERQVDAIIMLGGTIPDPELVELNKRIPLIMVGRHIPDLAEQCLLVTNYEGAYAATRYLLDLGHRQIAHITGIAAHRDARDRQRGYLQALADLGIARDDRLIVESNFVEQGGLVAVETLLSRGAPFSAIFAANDQMAYGARLGLHRRGLRVPEDVSLIGFDDLLNSAYTTPPLTSVRQHMLQQGRIAAQAILQLLGGEQPYIPAIETELIVRESTIRLRI